MMRTPVFTSFCFVLSALLIGSGHAYASPEPAPSGWSDTTEGDVRIVTNGTSAVEIGDWQDLNGQSLDAWLASMEHDVPPGSKLLSTDGVDAEHVSGAYSVGREVERDGKQRFSLLYACPGLDGVGRLIVMDIPMRNASELMTGGLFTEKVCENEPKHSVVADSDVVAVGAAVVEESDGPVVEPASGE